jgi:hypothetical protein
MEEARLDSHAGSSLSFGPLQLPGLPDGRIPIPVIATSAPKRDEKGVRTSADALRRLRCSRDVRPNS